MRTLRRRLLHWQRYDARAAKLIPVLADRGLRRGHYRAAKAADAEEQRRFWDETPEVWLGGPAGEAALIADVLGEPPDDWRLP